MSWSIATVEPQPGDFCEACRTQPVTHELTDSIEPAHPYRVCLACLERLETHTLRPLEYFDLTALHSPCQFHLHDDFYDEDGTSMALLHEVPNGKNEIAALPAPRLEEVQGDLERLVDYAFTRWHLQADVIDALRAHPPQALLSVLERRVARAENEAILATAVSVCAVAVGPIAAGWIRKCWTKKHAPRLLWSLAHASAACLPHEEGLFRVIDALLETRDNQFHQNAGVLAYFRNPRVVEWLEEQLQDPQQAVPENWGRLAAASGITWNRIALWLAKGRPLSLVGLDSLVSCFHYDTPLLRQFQPKLLDPPREELAFAALDEYAQRDAVPRVQFRVSRIKQNWREIVSAASA